MYNLQFRAKYSRDISRDIREAGLLGGPLAEVGTGSGVTGTAGVCTFTKAT